MKYLLALIIITSFIACGNPADKNTTAPKPPVPAIQYINNIAINTPGWDNNDATVKDLRDRVLKGFWKDVQDSNLLSGIPFKLVKVEKEIINDSYVATFTAFEFIQHDLRDNPDDNTWIDIELYATVPDTLAKSLIQGEKYFITSYIKSEKDTPYEDEHGVIAHNQSNTISVCDLGSNSIYVNKVQRAY